MKTNSRNEGGFTLISVLIALVLLAVGVMTLASTSVKVAESHNAAANRTTALSIARGQMEIVRSSPPAGLVSQPEVAVDETGYVVAGGKFSRQVVVSDVGINLKQVEVLVEYPRGTGPIRLLTMAYINTSVAAMGGP